jgi:FMN-dependent NADH-azoreductase
MRFLRLDASIRVEGSVSRALADIVEQEWRRRHPDAEVVHRDLGREPLPPVWTDALAGAMTPDGSRTDDQRRAAALAAKLVDELLAADALLFAVPLYNFGLPQQVKHWIDLVITDPRGFDVDRPLLPGRPAVLVAARGGGYGPGTPRAGWDHGTPYLRRMLVDVWGLDLRTAEAELTAAGTNPAMAHLEELAREHLAGARADALRHAADIAGRLGTDAVAQVT